MDKPSFLRVLLLMGSKDTMLEEATWKRVVLWAAGGIFLLGCIVLATHFSDAYLRLTSLIFILVSLGGVVLVLASVLANYTYRTWPFIVGTIVAGCLFLAAFVCFILSYQY